MQIPTAKQVKTKGVIFVILECLLFNRIFSAATDSGYVDIKEDEDALKAAVATVGPISVLIDTEASFYSYASGVYYEVNCRKEWPNHAVLLVGYGTDEETGEDYWLVKNSWGDKWGEGGYIRMARNRGNVCGIASYASYPIV